MKHRATVICERDGRVLLVARRGGRWAFPGGRQKNGEELARTAERELAEETQMWATSIRYAFQFKGLRTRHFVFVARFDERSEPLPSHEITRCLWVRLDELLQVEASIPTKGIAGIFLKQARRKTGLALDEALNTLAA
ncbi:NUDIX hydrolase [Caballeronia arationis]|nr:NUDIX domain-containing protein [Caballeronia arationis]